MSKPRSNAYIQPAAREDWGTPPEIFDPLHERFHFTIDGAGGDGPPGTGIATDGDKGGGNSKLARYWRDAFAQPWTGERVWINPPYGRLQTLWMEEAAKREADLSVLLIPSRTDTKAWHKHIFSSKAEVWFLKGRIKFVGATASAPFPSAVVIHRPDDSELVVRTGTLDEILAETSTSDHKRHIAVVEGRKDGRRDFEAGECFVSARMLHFRARYGVDCEPHYFEAYKAEFLKLAKGTGRPLPDLHLTPATLQYTREEA